MTANTQQQIDDKTSTTNLAMSITAYVDGSCSGGSGPGGWGVLAISDGKETEWSGGEPNTTNQRMEIMAAIIALEKLPSGSVVQVISDNQYLVKGITEWIVKWKRNGWRKADKKPVANKDLWLRLEAAAQNHSVKWKWVRGHSGNQGNERADALAYEACLKQCEAGGTGEAA